MELDAYVIGGGIFGVIAIVLFWKAYDYLVNNNPHALNLTGVKKYRIIMLYAVEHKIMWDDMLYDGFMADKSSDIYVPALRKNMKLYTARPNRDIILAYRSDDKTLVDPFLMNISVPLIYADEFTRLVGDEQRNSVVSVVEKAAADGKPRSGMVVALHAAFSEYSHLMTAFRDRANSEAKTIAKGTPKELGQQIKDMAPAITVAMGITFFFIMMAMQSFGVQSQTAKMISAPSEALLVCQTSLAGCNSGLLDVLYGKNYTLKNKTSGGILETAFGG